MTICNFDWGLFWESAKYLSWFEVMMLLCFGASWPFSILKTLRTGRSEGKSFIFLALVMFGYIFGLIHKLFYHLDVVVILYVLLFFVVGIDFVLSWRAVHRVRPAQECQECLVQGSTVQTSKDEDDASRNTQ